MRKSHGNFKPSRPCGTTTCRHSTGQDKALSQSKNAPAYDARGMLYQLTGVDLVAIPGLHASTVQTMVAEIGLDMGSGPTRRRSVPG
jgi:hypothetical protein